MGTAQPRWATCPTAWLSSWGESFSLYTVWTSPFSLYPLSLTHTTVLNGLLCLWLGKTLGQVLKSCWFLHPWARCLPLGESRTLAMPVCSVFPAAFCRQLPLCLCTVDQQPSHRAVLRGPHYLTQEWCFKGKSPKSQTLQHLHFRGPCPLSNPVSLVQ